MNDRERVIVYIDENVDDGMIWEELNQEGQMQVSVYDEELEYDVEYSHSIVVKSLQEYLAEHDKQIINDFVYSAKSALIDKIQHMKNEEHCYLQKAVKWEDIINILNKLGENK